MSDVNKVWVGGKGKWYSPEDTERKEKLINDNPTESNDDKVTVMRAYLKYVTNAVAAGDDKNPNYEKWNAKNLVWSLGNKRTLAGIRNIVYGFQTDLNKKFISLKVETSKPKETDKTRKARRKELFDAEGWSALVKS